MTESTIAVSRTEIVAVLSLATDMAMGQPDGFGLRSAIVASRLAEALGLDSATRAEVRHHALLRYVGCTAQTDVLAALFGDEIAFRRDIAGIDLARSAELLPIVVRHVLASAGTGRSPLAYVGAVVEGLAASRPQSEMVLKGHCEAAARLALRLDLPQAVASNLTQLYERWDGKGLPGGLAGVAIAPAVRVVNFVHDVLVLAAAMPFADTIDVIRRRRGSVYDPAVVDCFVRTGAAVLAPTRDEGLWEEALVLDDTAQLPLSNESLDAAIAVLSDFVDLKSPVIAGHSRAVAALAEGAASLLRLPQAERRAIRHAGLLHDIGFVAIPARLRLSDRGETDEQSRLHPYFGERLLARSPGLRRLGAIVAEHHERLDGSGFHRGSKGRDQSLAGRLLAVAEAYRSMIENRPFRVAVTGREAAMSIRQDVRAGRFDTVAAEAVLEAAGQRSRNKKAILPAGLTGREVEVLRLVAVGRPVKEIAARLGLAPKTVANHVQNLYGKIGVSTRAGATLFALERGILDPAADS